MAHIKMPELFPSQKIIVEHPADFKVVCCGRRWGKSIMARIMALDEAINKGGAVWWIAPTYSTLQSHWRSTRQMVMGKPYLTAKNEKDHYLEFKNSNMTGYLEFKSAERYDTLRGNKLTLAILDEAAFMHPEVWYDIVKPALLDSNGKAYIISTPQGTANWFYDVYQLGDPDSEKKQDNWFSFTRPTIDNPVIHTDSKKVAELQATRTTMSKAKFRQEFEASFESVDNEVFVDLDRIFVLGRKPREEASDLDLIMGIDWGRVNDPTVVSIIDKHTREQVEVIRLSNVGYVEQQTLVAQIIRLWKPMKVVVETNSIGNVMYEALRKEFGNLLLPVYMTNDVKITGVDYLISDFATGNLKMLAPVDEITSAQMKEFKSFQQFKTHSGQLTYSAPKGRHDDFVIATLLANYGSRKYRVSQIEVVGNMFFV